MTTTTTCDAVVQKKICVGESNIMRRSAGIPKVEILKKNKVPRQREYTYFKLRIRRSRTADTIHHLIISPQKGMIHFHDNELDSPDLGKANFLEVIYDKTLEL